MGTSVAAGVDIENEYDLDAGAYGFACTVDGVVIDGVTTGGFTIAGPREFTIEPAG